MKNDIIFIDENIPLLHKMLKNCGEVHTYTGRKLTRSDLIAAESNVLITRSQTKISKSLLEGTNVDFAATATAGIDHVDPEYLREKNIKFANAPGANANSVAEYVVYSMLKWAYMNSLNLRDMRIGVIGYGNIGKLVSRYAHWLGMKVYVNDPPLRDMDFEFPEHLTYRELPELCERMDVLTNHVPLEPEGAYPTVKLLDKELTGSMRSGSLLIHSSRGGVVDEEAVLDKIAKNDITAAVDVWENEPYFNPILAEKAMLCSPHVAGYSRDGKLKGTLMIAKAYYDYSGCMPNYTEIDKELANYKPMPPDAFSDHDYIRNTIEKSRFFEYDSAIFREITVLDEQERARQFDLQRKRYPVRREVL